MWVCATPATQSAAASRATKSDQARHPLPSVPRLPRQTMVDVSLCHTCHAKCRRCEFVPRLPRKTTVDVSLCHACHAKCRGVTGDQIRPSAPPSAISATPATPNDGRCEFVPRLPRKTKFVPRLPRKTTVDVSLCHACHAKCRGVTGDQIRPSAPPTAISATPATQNDGRCEFVPHLPRKVPQMWVCATPATQNDGRCDVWKMVCDKVVCERCERWCLTKLCVKDSVWQSCTWKMVCDKVVCERCERWCVTNLCVKDGVWQSCVKDGGREAGGWQREEAGRRRGSDPGYRIKNKNPTQSCGEKYMCLSENGYLNHHSPY